MPLNTAENMYTLLSIDAWRDPDSGWTWNDVRLIEENIYISHPVSNRRLLNFMRSNNWLNDYSKGRIAVKDTGYDIEIQNKNTSEPIFAFRPQFLC